MANNNLFWNQMLMRSDSIVDIDPNAPDAIEQVRAQLSTITEQFERVFDPADQFEEYVAVALCQALQRALTPKIAKPVCKVAVQRKPVAPTPPAPITTQTPDNPPTPNKPITAQTTPPQPASHTPPPVKSNKPQKPSRPKKRSNKRGSKR